MQMWITLFLMCWIYARAGAEETTTEQAADDAVKYLEQSIQSLNNAVVAIVKSGGPNKVLQYAKDKIPDVTLKTLEDIVANFNKNNKNDEVTPRFGLHLLVTAVLNAVGVNTMKDDLPAMINLNFSNRTMKAV